MRRKGFEPSHSFEYMHLKHARLPFRHLRLTVLLYQKKVKKVKLKSGLLQIYLNIRFEAQGYLYVL